MDNNSVALIVLDTLRKDRFDQFFDWLPGKRFEKAYATANWTSPVHASLFTGKYSTEVGVTAKSRTLNCPQQVLPELLKANGYETIGLSANPNVSSTNNFDRGFDDFTNPTLLKNPEHEDIVDWEQFISNTDSTGIRLYFEGIKEALRSEHSTLPSLRYGLATFLGNYKMRKNIPDSGASIVLQRVQEMSVHKDTFFFANLMEAHTPYDPPSEYNTLGESVQVTLKDTFDGVDNPEHIRTGYDDAVRYLSNIYEDIFSQLKKKFDYVITISDHGEMLGEQGLWNHTYGVHKPVTHVPLVISGQGLSGEESQPVSLLDVHQTVLAMCSVNGESRGVDLREDYEPKDALSQYRGLIQIAIDRLRDAGVSQEKIYEYDASIDALIGCDHGYAIETTDELITEDVSPDRARKRLTDIRDTIVEAEFGNSDENLDDDIMSQLEDLGYA
jgi:arylsulfatase